jgi:hypothetical protein
VIFVTNWQWVSFLLNSATCLSACFPNWAFHETLVSSPWPWGPIFSCILLFWLEDCYFCEKPIGSHVPFTCLLLMYLSYPKWSHLCHCSPDFTNKTTKRAKPNAGMIASDTITVKISIFWFSYFQMQFDHCQWQRIEFTFSCKNWVCPSLGG